MKTVVLCWRQNIVLKIYVTETTIGWNIGHRDDDWLEICDNTKLCMVPMIEDDVLRSDEKKNCGLVLF